MAKRRVRPSVLNVRNIPDDLKRRLASAKGAQGCTYVELLDRYDQAITRLAHEAQKPTASAVVIFARAVLEAVGLRHDLVP